MIDLIVLTYQLTRINSLPLFSYFQIKTLPFYYEVSVIIRIDEIFPSFSLFSAWNIQQFCRLLAMIMQIVCGKVLAMEERNLTQIQPGNYIVDSIVLDLFLPISSVVMTTMMITFICISFNSL